MDGSSCRATQETFGGNIMQPISVLAHSPNKSRNCLFFCFQCNELAMNDFVFTTPLLQLLRGEIFFFFLCKARWLAGRFHLFPFSVMNKDKKIKKSPISVTFIDNCIVQKSWAGLYWLPSQSFSFLPMKLPFEKEKRGLGTTARRAASF